MLGGFIAFCVCFNYSLNFKDWIRRINEGYESIGRLERQVIELQHQIVEMQLRLGWIKPHPDEPDTFIQNDEKDIKKEHSDTEKEYSDTEKEYDNLFK